MQQTSAAVSEVLHEALGLNSERLFMTFEDVPASNWGMSGSTVADLLGL